MCWCFVCAGQYLFYIEKVEQMNAIIFCVTFLLVILVTRIFLHFTRLRSPSIKIFRLHHYMYGIVIMISGVFFWNLILFSVGYGLFLDELPCLAKATKFGYSEYSDENNIRTLVMLCLVTVLIIVWVQVLVQVWNFI